MKTDVMLLEETITKIKEKAQEFDICAAEHKQLAIWLEELNHLRKKDEMIHSSLDFYELDNIISQIEDALGFKLYIWQKTYIQYGEMRKTGKTTAYILRQLLNTDNDPLDLSTQRDYARNADRIANVYYKTYKTMVKEIYEKLVRKGIPVRKVFFTPAEAEEYRKNRKEKFKDGSRGIERNQGHNSHYD